MVRSPRCFKEGLKRGAWTRDEDMVLSQYISANGVGDWPNLPEKAGLKRCGKSCRLRWLNYLRPDIKRGNISEDEEELISRLHKLLGNRWSLIAGRLPGRTDNEIKNYWNTTLRKKYENNSEDMCKNEEQVTKTLPVKPVAIRPKVMIERHAEEKPKNDSETRMPISLSWEETRVWSGHDGENANMKNLSNPVCSEDYGFDEIKLIFNPSNKSLAPSPSLCLTSLEEEFNEWSNMDAHEEKVSYFVGASYPYLKKFEERRSKP